MGPLETRAGRDFHPEAAAFGCGENYSLISRVPRMLPVRLRPPCWRTRLRSQREEGFVANILVCDDERSICEMLDIALRREGHRVETVQSGQAAKNKIDGALYDVIVTDIKMPSIDGIEVLRHAHRVSPDSAVILITAVDDYEAAVEAVKAGGASDYIRKNPGLVDEIKLAINRVLEKLVLSKQNFALRRDAATRNSLDNIIGSSGAMEKLKADGSHRGFYRQHGTDSRRKRNR